MFLSFLGKYHAIFASPEEKNKKYIMNLRRIVQIIIYIYIRRYLLQDHLNLVFLGTRLWKKHHEGLEAEIFNSTELDLSHLLVTKMGFRRSFFWSRKIFRSTKKVGNVEATLFVMMLL